MKATNHTLQQLLQRFDGKGYKAYKQIAGEYQFPGFTLFIDHVQGDPFSAPSRMRLRVPAETAALPPALVHRETPPIALCNFVARSVRRAIADVSRGRRGTGNSGRIEIDAGGQEILERTSMVIGADWIEARVAVGLPADGRTIRGRDAIEMLCGELPAIADQGLVWNSLDAESARRFVGVAQNYRAVRDQLRSLGLVSFIADGSILARASGVSDAPLDAAEATALRSDPPLRVSLEIPNGRDGRLDAKERITGLGIPRGVTVIVGGGYHGKSTLLNAVQRGVYPHVPGDGRELVVTDPDAVKVRSEDGRRVAGVDIRAFVGELPYGRKTHAFTTDDASGSTSQAASIVEAVESGTSALLLDEDTSATNFMVRDARMQALVAKSREPITPFIDRVRALYEVHGVSSVIVMGGCGDYFDVADTVLEMHDYLPADVTARARDIAGQYDTRRAREESPEWELPGPRPIDVRSIDPSWRGRDARVRVPDTHEISFGRERVDLRALEQLVDASQTRAIAELLVHASRSRADIDMAALLDRAEELLNREGLDALTRHAGPGEHPGCMARPRRHEIAAALNRLRSLRTQQS